MPNWAIPKQLVRSHRPGYSGERGKTVPQAEVDAWIEEVAELGVRSIICLLADDELALYSALPDGLLAYYRTAGFRVEHVPAPDHARPPLMDIHLQRIWDAYQALPKPVLIHCSAGIDRTGRAVEHVKNQIDSRS